MPGKLNIKNTMERFNNLLKFSKLEIYQIYLYAIFTGIITLSLPLGISAIINFLQAGVISTSWLVLSFIVTMGVVIAGFLQIRQIKVMEALQQKIFTTASFEFAYRIPKLKPEQVDKYYLPELTNRFFETITIQKGLGKLLIDISTASIQILFGLILISIYDPLFIVLSLFLLLFLFLVFRFTIKKGLETSYDESNNKFEIAHWLEELARCQVSFKLAGKQSLGLNKTDRLVREYLNNRTNHFSVLLKQFNGLVIFKAFVTASLLIAGGYLVIEQQINIGQFVAAEIIILLIINSIEKLIQNFETIYDVLTAVEKMGVVTDFPLDPDEKPIANFSGEGIALSTENLCFKFPDQEGMILKNLNINIEKGEKVCIAGLSGSGKTVLLKIFAGIFSDYQGNLLFNNYPARQVLMDNLREKIGACLQQQQIFSASVKNNILVGKTQISEADLQEVIEITGLKTFLKNQPKGLDTIIGAEGLRLSRNIQNKLILARCLVNKPQLILLEEAILDIDKTDRDTILNYLFSQQNVTVIINSNSAKIAEKSSQVIILQSGVLVANGKYDLVKETANSSEIFIN